MSNLSRLPDPPGAGGPAARYTVRARAGAVEARVPVAHSRLLPPAAARARRGRARRRGAAVRSSRVISAVPTAQRRDRTKDAEKRKHVTKTPRGTVPLQSPVHPRKCRDAMFTAPCLSPAARASYRMSPRSYSRRNCYGSRCRCTVGVAGCSRAQRCPAHTLKDMDPITGQMQSSQCHPRLARRWARRLQYVEARRVSPCKGL